MGTLVERPHVVGPHAAGVDDRSGRDVDRRPVGLDHGTGDATVTVDDLDHAGAVDDDGPVLGRGAGDREREPGIVGGGVVVEEAAAQLVEVGAREVRRRLLGRQPPVQLADAPSAREVVHPQRGAQRLGDLPRDHPVLRHDRDEEREHLDHVGRVAHQPAPLVERLVHEPDVTVLQVPQPTVDQLRTLRRRAAGEVVALDQRHSQAAMRRVEGDAGAGDATADHEHVERVVTVERVPAELGEHGRALERQHSR